MAKQRPKVEFRYYVMPIDTYVLPKLGKGWEQEYGIGYDGVLHFHNYFEVGYCYRGKGMLQIEDTQYRYHGRMFSCIPAKIPHTTVSDPGNICKWEFLFLDLEGFIANEMKDLRLSPGDISRITGSKAFFLSLDKNPHLARLIRQMIEECREERPYMRESLRGYLRAFTVELLRLHEKEAVDSPSRVPDAVRTATDYMEAHYTEDLRIGEIAEACCLSESHFRRLFEQSMHMNPVEYLHSIRIRRACLLMEKENLPMSEVGFRVGYTTPSTFNRNFRRMTGQTPYQWKRDTGTRNGTHWNIQALQGWEGLDADGRQVTGEDPGAVIQARNG